MQQRFVDLDRYFVPVKGEQALSDGSSYWGRRYGGWVRWPQLLSHRRVVVLAGAGSGKTEEFKHQTRMQRQRGRAAFFVRLEELADTPFVDAIDHQLSSDFDGWLQGNEPGWFFLDAVDELKLRGKRFDAALRAIAKSLHLALDRAHIVISSRPTDWDWRTDPGTLSDRLRPLEPEPRHVELDPDAALVGPILERRPREATTAKDVGAAFEIRTFSLASLEPVQVRQIAEANGIALSEPFLDAIAANNLDSLAQTPLDVEILVAYWKGKGRLDRLAQMVEYAVGRKLVEREPNRPDGDQLSLEDARRGCERIAAALTFGKALSVRFSLDDAHPTMEETSPEIASVLPEWSEAKRAALLRRGVFAPATFGRVRFHHPQTQDFLTACWLDRLMRDGHDHGAVLRLAFPEVHGEEIVVPSLVPALSWLALRQPTVRNALLERQPLALVQSGDPSSLSLDDRKRVLTRYAALHRAGKVSNDMIWGRQLALFSDAGLAGTIRDIWKNDPAADVRFQLLRLVGEAGIAECADLCGEVAIDDSAKDYHRIVAVQALARCKADGYLAHLADRLFNDCAAMAEHVCCGFALELFPRQLDAVQLASIIDRTPRSRKLRTDGFADKLDEFLATCRNAQDRRALLSELVRLCRQKPLSHDYERVSAKHKALAEHLGPLVRDALNRLGAGEPPSTALVRALRVMQWVHDLDGRDEEETLSQLVRRNFALNRALYWHSVIEERIQKPDRSTDHWQLLPWRSGRQFWSLIGEDWDWLIGDVRHARRIENRRAALVAAHVLVARNEAPPDAVDLLRSAASDAPVLVSALDELIAPRPLADWERDQSRRERRRECKARIREIRTERNWKAFRDRLAANPASLMDTERITSPENVRDLRALTDWLAKPKDYLERDVALDWSRLELPFGRATAEAYRDGMRRLWRQASPARPTRSVGGGVSTPWINILAFRAVLMEAREDTDWPAGLSDAEAERAVGHLVLTEEGIADELVELAGSHPDATLRVLAPALREEAEQPDSSRQILYHVARTRDALRQLLAPLVVDLVAGEGPEHLDVHDLAIEAIRDLDLHNESLARLRRCATQRLKSARSAGNEELALRSIALRFLVDPPGAMKATRAWLGKPQKLSRESRAERFFAVLFGRDRALVTTRLATLPVGRIEQLYRLCHARIRSEHDQDRAGGPAYSPNDRDRAEEARNGFLNAIINRPGLPSYEALHRLGNDRLWDASSQRAFELARERAERDGDLPAPWTPLEVIEFERRRLSPIKNGDDLMRLVTEVLHDIQSSFERDDATSRDLLALAPDEDHVQNWFAEQLNLRSNHCFHAFREPRVASKKRSDVIVASTACDAQLAVEIKHGGKGWTVRDLERALTAQLAERYLKPMNRRHGILLVTNHNRHYWSCPESRRQLLLAEVISKLNRRAVAEQAKADNSVQMRAVGLDVRKLRIDASTRSTALDVPRGHSSPQPNGAERTDRRRRSAA